MVGRYGGNIRGKKIRMEHMAMGGLGRAEEEEARGEGFYGRKS